MHSINYILWWTCNVTFCILSKQYQYSYMKKLPVQQIKIECIMLRSPPVFFFPHLNFSFTLFLLFLSFCFHLSFLVIFFFFCLLFCQCPHFCLMPCPLFFNELPRFIFHLYKSQQNTGPPHFKITSKFLII